MRERSLVTKRLCLLLAFFGELNKLFTLLKASSLIIPFPTGEVK